MRFFNQQHKYYCGIDLHTKTIYVCIMDQAGQIVLHQNLPVDSDSLLKLIMPFMPDIVISVECIFPAWAGLNPFAN